MKAADIATSAVVALFGLVVLSVVIPTWVPIEEGPEFGLSATTMPNVATVCATALAVLFLAHRLIKRRPLDDAEDVYDSTPPIPRASWWFLLRGGVFLIAVAALFEWLGFLVAGPPTVAGFMIMMGERRPWPVAITAVAATVAIWLFFWQFLKFPLP